MARACSTSKASSGVFTSTEGAIVLLPALESFVPATGRFTEAGAPV
jgi:hypothetical protein